VNNFVKYVTDGDYNGSFFHRSVPGFVVQGGGFRFQGGVVSEVPADPAVVNEYKRPNTYGTLAMAKLGDQPNSATNQWFLNVADNTSILNTSNNGGFTVFGEVIPSDIPVLADIAAIRPYDLSASLGGTFAEVPLLNPDANRSSDDFINVESAYLSRRDVAAQAVQNAGPLSKVVALGNFGLQFTGSGVRIPVRVNGKLYQLVLNRSDDDATLFSVDLIRIVELKDSNRIAANFDGVLLTIPTVRVGDNVYANVTLRVTDTRTLTFKLESVEQLP